MSYLSNFIELKNGELNNKNIIYPTNIQNLPRPTNELYIFKENKDEFKKTIIRLSNNKSQANYIRMKKKLNKDIIKFFVFKQTYLR